MGYLIPPVCSRFVLEFPLIQISLEYLHREESMRRPDLALEPPQLVFVKLVEVGHN